MQKIIQVDSLIENEIVIDLIAEEDLKKITKSRYFFNWKTEKKNLIYKLSIVGSDDILGVMSLIHIPEEMRFQINLLAVSIENRGIKKEYEGIAGNLIAYACRECQKLYGIDACVSLVPKTVLKNHYILKYGMLDSGAHVALMGRSLLKIQDKYNI